MRKLTAAVFQSLDCVMQAPGGPDEDPTSNFKFGGWSQPLFAQNMGPFEALIASDYDLLLGKRTYDIFASYWPYNQDHPVGEKFERINKYVLTHSNEPLDWRNSYRLSGETADAVVELKRTDGRDLLIQGSSTLYPPLLSERLIDQLIVMTFPVVLGSGKSIFDGSEKAGALKLVDHFVAETGVTIATYEPAGDVRTGTFETKKPSEQELQRREKMREGGW